jgi:DNA-directed RNA polymerase subunit RPC12/RpoP
MQTDATVYMPPAAAREGVPYICGGALPHPPVRQLAALLQRSRPADARLPDCGFETNVKPGDHVQCRECGYRILYKKRTKRSACPWPALHAARRRAALGLFAGLPAQPPLRN